MAIDPGAILGFAVFDEGELTSAGHFRFDEGNLTQLPRGPECVIERPQYRTGCKTPVEDLIQLSMRAGTIAGLYMAEGSKVELVRPTSWKGSVPKEIHQKRIWAALAEVERGKLPKNHNAVDAVGLGLWRLKRLAR